MGSTRAAITTALTQCVIAWLIAFAVRCVGLAFGWHKEAQYMNLPTILILALIGIRAVCRASFDEKASVRLFRTLLRLSRAVQK